MPRYKATVELSAGDTRIFRSHAAAVRWQAALEAKLAEANKLADGEIWTSIELIYITRIDCRTMRLAAA